MTSLLDIAKRAGVSVKTVSVALNGTSGRMATETRERIQAIAAELNYVIDANAQATRQGSLPAVGMLADGVITSPFATEIVRVFDTVMRRNDLSLIVTTLRKPELVRREVESLRRFKPRGIVYASMFHKPVDLPEEVRDTVEVMVNCYDVAGIIPSIVPDEEQAGFEISSALLAAGRRRIAFLNLQGLVAARLREVGFRRAHAEHGCAVVEDFLRPATSGALYSDHSKSLLRQHAEELLALAQPPDAIICGNDRLALELYGIFAELGVKIPSDIAVGSFDNHADIARRLNPALTTMALPHRQMAKAAADHVIGTRLLDSGQTRLKFQFIKRASI